MNEAEVGQRFQMGGEEVLTEVITLYGEKLLRYATAIACQYQDAEDVVQEVFISAYQNRCRFDGKNLSAWLYKITYNLSLNHVKRQKILSFSEMKEDMAASEADPDLSAETLQALQRLSPKERAVIYGRIMDECSYEELSRMMGCSVTALRKQYERAKKKLADHLTNTQLREEHSYE